MKLFTFVEEKNNKLGIKVGEQFIDVQETATLNNWDGQASDIMQIMELGTEQRNELQTMIDQAIENGTAALLKEEIVWGPCVTRPQKIICVGLNYRKHADETNAPYPEVPILFNKFNNTLIGNKSEIPIPAVTNELDYEVELGVVIGKRTKNVSEEEALDHVFGYCTVNDLSARDLQMKTPQWMLGKVCDKFSPVGPYLVTADEVGDPNNLDLKTYVNDKLRQDSNTSDMIFPCKAIVSYISKHLTLEPGDLILTGTPEGVVLGLPPEQRVFIQPGDIVTVEIEKLGTLTNQFVAEKEYV